MKKPVSALLHATTGGRVPEAFDFAVGMVMNLAAHVYASADVIWNDRQAVAIISDFSYQ
jgi:hypothetical protein